MAIGIRSQAVKEEFKEHAREEQVHAERIAERVMQLGGKPEMNPAMLTDLSHSEYREGGAFTLDREPANPCAAPSASRSWG